MISARLGHDKKNLRDKPLRSRLLKKTKSGGAAPLPSPWWTLQAFFRFRSLYRKHTENNIKFNKANIYVRTCQPDFPTRNKTGEEFQ